MKIKKRLFLFTFFIAAIIFLNCIPIIYATVLPNFAIVVQTTENPVYKKEESSIQTNAVPTFNFTSKAQILIEQCTGNVIYANNELETLAPASITKIMTILLIMDSLKSGKISLTDTVTCSENAASMGGSQIWFKVR